MKRIVTNFPRLALAALPAAALAFVALAEARQGDFRPGHGDAAFETDPAMAFVDPVVTGPVSPQYELVRRQAGCDGAQWPHVPSVCYPR